MVLLIFQVCTFNKILNFFFNFAGCKESQFYSLPFRHAVVSMYYLKSQFNKSEKNILMSRIDLLFSNLNFPKK